MLVPKLKILYLLKFNSCNISSLYFNIKNNFYQKFTTRYAQIGHKIKTALKLLKFGTLDPKTRSKNKNMWNVVTAMTFFVRIYFGLQTHLQLITKK